MKTEKREHEEPGSVLLRGIFKLGKISHDVLLTSTSVSWTPITPDNPTGYRLVTMAAISPDNPTGEQGSERGSHRVWLRDVFAVKVKRRRAAGQQTGGAVLGLCLFCSHRTGNTLQEVRTHLLNTSLSLCHTWVTQLTQLLTVLPRPKQLKVFINPGSHKKQSVLIYREHIAPLFRMADIHTDITITERKGHILMVVKECSLTQYDGVVCVGGDGTVAELAHALVLRAQLESQRDPDCDLNPVQATLPLGIIPAGSTDIISCSVHGVRHPITAALHIILGHLQQVDMCSFSSLGRLLTFGFSAMFGFGGRSLALAERNRWMPPSQRRDYALAKTVASLRPEECHLSFLPVNQKHKSGKRRSKEQDAATGLSWETKPGVYLSISIMSIPSLTPHAPRGLAPNTRLTNGSAELITVGNASRSEFIRHLKRYSCPDEQSSLSFVETRSVTAVKLRPYGLVGSPGKGEKEEATSGDDSEGSFPWNIDGELVEMAHEVVVRVHSRLISLYGEDVEKVDSPVMSCSCI
ncbi:ceramide kinase-like protein isoform X2 [Gadus macrocephalus]|uniref:ceramide kinase-like protein isoform X2 n=1 Tax=Gadus macrocephalus TaxID=80720 RepID=UPI0028CB1460|nr:ceramide kinase-like protein isoform X2 [Gadus macrocephalus]